MAGDREYIEASLSPAPDDSTDVRWALETAGAMWVRGNREQTLKWLEAAMKAATTDGRHDRAYALGRVLGELEQRTTQTKKPEAPALAPLSPASITAPVVTPTARLPGAATGRSNPHLRETAPYRIYPDEVTEHFAPDSALLEACQTTEPELAAEHQVADSITDIPTPEVLKVPKERPRPPTIMTDGLDKTLTHVRPAPPAYAHDTVEHTVVMSAEELAQPSVRQGPPTTLGSPQRTLEPMRALRVRVVRAQGREIVLALLDEGEPNGDEQEALLVPLGRSR